MHEGLMRDWVRLTMAIGGALSIYIGYKFFCDLPFRKAKTLRGVLLVNLISGALLAVFGTGLLIADFRGIRRDANQARDSRLIRRKGPARQGSFTPPPPARYKSVPAGVV